jgi:hypothetical protein
MLAASSLAIFVVAAWWWVTWPERTMHDFASLMAAGKLDDAKPMMLPGSASWFVPAQNPNNWSSVGIQGQPRTWRDVLAARQEFKLESGRTMIVEGDKVGVSFLEVRTKWRNPL